jgi:hypothetical protein
MGKVKLTLYLDEEIVKLAKKDFPELGIDLLTPQELIKALEIDIDNR